ncbi:MAG: tRNA pseudouridine(13) synthase TruD [Phycisphaerae bacterium]|jgi:tRNA pseudouridine13 synthase
MSAYDPHTHPVPFLTAELPGTGGVIKRYDEDFVVEELPLYPAAGEGTHTYFVLEKRGLTTPAAIDLVARALGRNRRDFGYAGLKDAHGVTRQVISIEHVDPDRVASLEFSKLRIRSVTRHTNKIKLGHLAGNRFDIKIRDACNAAGSRAEPILNTLARRGGPNYFGPQRFGARGDNAVIGRAILCDDYDEALARLLGRPGPHDRSDVRKARELFDAGDLTAAADAWPRAMDTQRRVCRALSKSGGDARKAWRAVDHSLRKLYVSAVQSELFNEVLARRIDRLDRFIDGDIAWIHRNGACFRVEEVDVEQPRCDAFEISPTGPLFGKRMTEPTGAAGELEGEILAGSGITKDRMRAKDGTKLDGARRPLRVPVQDLESDEGEDHRGPYLRLCFSLPPGAYATNITREVCKTD